MFTTPEPNRAPFIGLFNDSFPPILDGVTLTVQNYALWLAQEGHSPVVVTPWNPERYEADYPVMRFFSLPIANRHPYRYGYPKLDPFIWRRLLKTPFQILHSHCPFSSGRLAVFVKKHQHVPLIATFHSKYKTDLEHSFRHTPWMVPIIMKRILNFFNSCDEVWIPQLEVEETVREYGFKGSLTVVDNGIDFAGIPDEEVSAIRRQAREEAGLKDETVSLLFVGQHIREKGVDVILEALSMLPPQIDFHMDFIGSGYFAEDAKQMAKRLKIDNRVTFHGIITDRRQLRSHYAAADLFLFPSFYDNAPLVVREAAAMETPSLLLEGSTAANVITDGRNGFLTKRNPSDFAAAIASIASDRQLLASAGRLARTSIVRSWQDVVSEVVDRYRVILKNHSK